MGDEFEITRGRPLPLGAHVLRGGINFSVFSRHARSVRLVLFTPGTEEPLIEFPLDPLYHRTGYVWHAFIRGLDPGIEYGYRMDGPSNNPRHRFDPSVVLLDPYAKALSGGVSWGDGENPRHALVTDHTFDWGLDRPLNTHLADTVIYELHVRSFTRHPSSGVAQPGTFRGVAERIPYLKDLGVTAVELMPVTEFNENDLKLINPFTGERLVNLWGYDPISFFAPKAAYAADASVQGALDEFKQMVKMLHEAGIEVILDMVFNHTGESDETGPTINYRGIDNAVYYMVDPETGVYENFSGCGNTLNCNHPVVRSLIMDALRYWVTEMHVDGFRFDLASILGRGQDGEVMADPPLLERIAAEPVLANTKLIAEAWDAAGLYQVGSFPNWGRWAEWNGRFRDDIRRFVRGDPGMVPVLATRMAGSSDLYQHDGRAPYHSVNFVTSHDGFTLHDLVSYEEKHNEANGQKNQDGDSTPFSWHCGVEGPTTSETVQKLRKRQIKNMAALLLLAQGVPMILSGDEFGRTQQGNNNAYCQDNEISWIDWNLQKTHGDLHRFFKQLIAFRKAHAVLRRHDFFEPEAVPTITWHGFEQGSPDWSEESRSLGMHFVTEAGMQDLYIIAHAGESDRDFALPALSAPSCWSRVVDTGLDSPQDIAEPGREESVGSASTYRVSGRSVTVFLQKSV